MWVGMGGWVIGWMDDWIGSAYYTLMILTVRLLYFICGLIDSIYVICGLIVCFIDF